MKVKLTEKEIEMKKISRQTDNCMVILLKNKVIFRFVKISPPERGPLCRD